MAKLAQATSKYCIHAKFVAEGIVEKPDVIGAVFGQTEGLLGSDMDLRELQKTGRIGRVDVELETKDGKTEGRIDIPSSLDASETSLIAATLETIERIGPCDTKIEIDKVEDVRSNKREYLMKRAKELLSSTFDESELESDVITEQLKESVRESEITKFEGLDAGPAVLESDSIIICEGRADVIKLLRNGIKNAIAVGGTSIPDVVAKISKHKECTAFLDGDRGGDLIIKEMKAKGVDLDYVARAPEGKEVEELTKKEIYKAIRERAPLAEAKDIRPAVNNSLRNGGPRTSSYRNERRSDHSDRRRDDRRGRRDTRDTRRDDSRSTSKPIAQRPAKVSLSESETNKIQEYSKELKGSDSSYVLDGKMEILGKIKNESLSQALRGVSGAKYLVIDGDLGQRVASAAEKVGVRAIYAKSKKPTLRYLKGISLLTPEDIKKEGK